MIYMFIVYSHFHTQILYTDRYLIMFILYGKVFNEIIKLINEMKDKAVKMEWERGIETIRSFENKLYTTRPTKCWVTVKRP